MMVQRILFIVLTWNLQQHKLFIEKKERIIIFYFSISASIYLSVKMPQGGSAQGGGKKRRSRSKGKKSGGAKKRSGSRSRSRSRSKGRK